MLIKFAHYVRKEKIMIRSISLALVLSLMMFSVAEAKIAAAPFNEIIQESPMGKAAQALMKSRVGNEQAKLEKDITAFQKEAQAFQKQAAALSEKARMEKAQALDKKMRNLDEKRNALGQKAGPIQQKLNQAIFEIIQEATETVAKDKNLEMILDAAPPVYYVANSVNLKAEILAEVNKIWKKKGSKFNI